MLYLADLPVLWLHVTAASRTSALPLFAPPPCQQLARCRCHTQCPCLSRPLRGSRVPLTLLLVQLSFSCTSLRLVYVVQKVVLALLLCSTLLLIIPFLPVSSSSSIYRRNEIARLEQKKQNAFTLLFANIEPIKF